MKIILLVVINGNKIVSITLCITGQLSVSITGKLSLSVNKQIE